MEIAQRAKLDVVGMHCEPLAIAKAFAHLFRGEESERTTCFIDLGAATTKVVITHGPEMVFTKTIHAAGDHLTRHRAVAENITFTEAREALRDALGAKQCRRRQAVRGFGCAQPRPAMAGVGADTLAQAHAIGRR